MKQPSLRPAIDCLIAWRGDLIERLKAGDESVLSLKLAADTAVRWLEVYEREHLDLRPEVEVFRLPVPDNYEPFGEYRVMWDHETEERASWQEVARAFPDDLLLRHTN